MAGLGKLAPNMLIMGFKADWKDSLNKGPMSSSAMDTREYMTTLICALDQKLSVAILRVS